jgi:hypothetical protein
VTAVAASSRSTTRPSSRDGTVDVAGLAPDFFAAAQLHPGVKVEARTNSRSESCTAV